MSNLSKKLNEAFDCLDSCILNEDSSSIENVIKSLKPEDSKYIVYSCDIDSDEVCLYANGTDIAADRDSDDRNLDEVAISALESWAKKIAEKLPSFREAIEDEISSDWYSGMSVYGESGPYTCDGFTLTLYLDE